MHHLRFILRLFLFLAMLASIPAFVFFNVLLERENQKSRGRYTTTREELAVVTGRMQRVEHRLAELRESVEAVEQEARTQFHMVKDRETLVLIERE